MTKLTMTTRMIWWLGTRFPSVRDWYIRKTGEWLWGVALFVEEVTLVALEPDVQKWMADCFKEADELARAIDTAPKGRTL